MAPVASEQKRTKANNVQVCSTQRVNKSEHTPYRECSLVQSRENPEISLGSDARGKGIIREMIHLVGCKDVSLIRKRLTFPNPKFLEAEKQGRWTVGLAREVHFYRETHNEISVPWGAKFWLDAPLQDLTETAPVSISFTGVLREYQEEAVQRLQEAGGGVLVAATGSGKTCSAIGLSSRLGERTLVLVKSIDLAKQWIEAINRFTGLDAGLIGGGKDREGAEFTIALVQTLAKRPGLQGYGCLIVDEAHNVPAQQTFDVINRSMARYRYGLSATPERRDGMEPLLFAALGPIAARIDESDLNGAVLPVIVHRVEHRGELASIKSWTDFIKVISRDLDRNSLIARSAIKASKLAGTIVLASTIEHCEVLAELCPDALVIHGQLPKKLREERMLMAPEAKLIIGTLSLLSEGIDLPHLTNLIFAAPVSASIDRATPAATRLIQSIGRARRPYPEKKCAFVMDIVDCHPLGYAAAKKRLAIYERMGFGLADRTGACRTEQKTSL